MESVTVVGAGKMGGGIAQVLALAGYDVQLHDLQPQVLTTALERIEGGRFGLRRGAELGKISPVDVDAALDRIHLHTELGDACVRAILVVEAVFEKIELKLKLFRQLDHLAPPEAVLASNTSGFSITALAAMTNREDKVIGWHWASPVAVMRLAEIVVHPGTSDETRDLVVNIARRAGKNPIVVRDQPNSYGFVADRIWFAVYREADAVVAEGLASPEQVDQLLKDCFRWPTGPFEMRHGRSW